MRKLLLLLTFVLAVAVWGGRALAEPARGADAVVSVFDFDYAPDPVIIQPGQTVQWQNDEGFHNVVADDNSFSSGAASSDPWVFNHTFDDPGYFPYYCTIHGGPGGIGMAGVVLVGGNFLPAVIGGPAGGGPTPMPPAP